MVRGVEVGGLGVVCVLGLMRVRMWERAAPHQTHCPSASRKYTYLPEQKERKVLHGVLQPAAQHKQPVRAE